MKTDKSEKMVQQNSVFRTSLEGLKRMASITASTQVNKNICTNVFINNITYSGIYEHRVISYIKLWII